MSALLRRSDLAASEPDSSSVSIAGWTAGEPPRPSRLVLRDHLNGGKETRAEPREFEEGTAPEGLFSLEDDAARRQLDDGVGRP